MQKEAAMNKDEILEKSRRDNDGMDERFKLMQWRASYLMLSVMMVVWALLFVWDSLHGQSTDVSFAIVMSGIAAMNFYQSTSSLQNRVGCGRFGDGRGHQRRRPPYIRDDVGAPHDQATVSRVRRCA